MQNRRKLSLVLAALFSVGCAGKIRIYDPGNCTKPKDKEKQTPWKTPELIRQGENYLNQGLRSPGSGDHRYVPAANCFFRALELNPENYSANVGLGVTHLARAKRAKRKSTARTTFLTTAKRALGKAYMVRHGPMEVLYYLAEVAMVEDDYETANDYLHELEQSKHKLGPVYTLLGFIAKKQGNRTGSYEYYQKALEQGWPYETLLYVAKHAPKKRRRRAKRNKRSRRKKGKK
jgi:tetratricopeptide (TPR) repeat protein